MKRGTKKLLAMILAGVLAVGSMTGCGGDDSAQKSDDNAQKAAEIFGDVTPLEESEALEIGVLVGGTHGFASYLIERLGGFEYANIDEEIIFSTIKEDLPVIYPVIQALIRQYAV